MIDIELKKAYAIYKQSGLIPSEFLKKIQKTPFAKDLKFWDSLG